MKITLAKSAGFCFGVDRAVSMLEELVGRGGKICTYGPIIHNPQFVEKLKGQGVRIIQNISEADPGSIVVIRTHGVPMEVYRELEARKIEYVDATCPFVAKIHRIVWEASRGGDRIFIAGDPDHPEVEGIRGHCLSDSFVFRNLQELEDITRRNSEVTGTSVTAVSQTTFNADEWRKCRVFLEKVYTKVNIFDTICSATSIRQQEAKSLAEKSDIMLIIGGRHSSNTTKLLAVCESICPSYLIESADELPKIPALNDNPPLQIGVTAGASTPACIIKEVLKSMADLENKDKDNDNEELSFAEAFEKSLKTLSNDDVVRGVVIGMTPNEVEVDVGTKHAGYIPLSELTDDPQAKPEQLAKIGDEIDLVVMRVNDQDGTVTLSKKRYDAIRGWEEIVKANEEDQVISGVVTDVIKGGLLAVTNGIKVFIPASQSGVSKNENLDQLLRQTVDMKIIEINRGRRRAVGSIRAVLREHKKEMAEKFWSEVEIGKEYRGKVKSLTSYGAFVDLGGVDGMIHVSELSWSRIKHPSEVVNVGDEVDVIVKDINYEAKKISLTYKNKGENPWLIFLREYHVDDIIDAKIVSFMPFGSFAQIIPGVDGLIHISQISDRHIAKPSDVLEMGQVVKVKILDINEERKRISLSIKEADSSQTDVPIHSDDGENA